jgi:hypothetical protein
VALSSSISGSLRITNCSPAPSPLRRSALLLCAALAIKREAVKKALFVGGMPELVARNLRAPGTPPGLVKDSCVVLSRMLNDDDLSTMVSGW